MELKAIRFVEGTKISHDYKGDEIELFSYRDLINKGIPAIGIPCKQNGIIVIDVDAAGENHKKDGREWWAKFVEANGIPQTYTVGTRSGGYHFYFKLPEAVNPDTFMCPANLADGVDIKWKGWVGAPPSKGYNVFYGTINDIIYAPPSLMMEISNRYHNRSAPREFEYTGDYNDPLTLHRPFTPDQIRELKKRLEWAQSHASLSYADWRDGLFSLKSGITDPALLEELALKWTYNKSYNVGDEHTALKIVHGAEVHGGVGPGTIEKILSNLAMREDAPVINSPLTRNEVLEKAKVNIKMAEGGGLKVKGTETNASAIIGSLYDVNNLYWDVRQDQFMFQGKPISDTELTLKITPQIQSTFYGLGLEDFKMNQIAQGVEILMTIRQIDPHKKWLESLEWDKTPRIDTFFQYYVGVPESEYIRKVSKNFWLSMAARGLDAGCKCDSMVVLEGHEGIRKSTLVQAIGGEYTFTPSTDDLMNDTDELRKMHQSIIVEIPELMGLMNQKPTKVQAFLTKPFDHIRALYSKRAIKKNRGFIFVGTTNNSKYLSSEMGVRRFWPVRVPTHVKAINTTQIVIDREQLFAEAVYRYQRSESHYDMPQDILAQEVISRTQVEPLVTPMKGFLDMCGPTTSVYEMYTRLETANIITRGLTPAVAKRIEMTLKALGAKETILNGEALWIPKQFDVPTDLSAFL